MHLDLHKLDIITNEDWKIFNGYNINSLADLLGVDNVRWKEISPQISKESACEIAKIIKERKFDNMECVTLCDIS